MIRIKLLLSFFVLCLLAIMGKLFYLQVIQPSMFSTDYLQSRKIYPERGKIYDRNKLPLAVNQTTYKLFVEPKVLNNRDEVIKKIDEMLHIGEATLNAKIDKNKDWVPIQGGITKEVRDKVLALDMNGVGFDNEPKRFYPESSLSAHLLGFVGKDEEGQDTGYFGLEGFYEKDLVGLPGFLKSERDVFNKPIFVGTQERVNAENGRDLVLTVDRSVQNIVKEKMVAAMKEYKPVQACATVANPKTMEILAMVCLPDFDPTDYFQASPSAYANTAISYNFEPGSTFKPLIMAAALQEKKIKPLDMYDESGPIRLSGYTINNWNKKYEGKISMTHILEKSSNVGMVHVGNKLGEDKLYEYLGKYGFGEPTNIDLQGEASGYIKPQNEFYPIDYPTASFGQGISVTQIQMITAFSSLINGGYLMQPYVVREVHQGDKIRERKPKVVRQVVSETTSEIMKKMLQASVDHAEMKFTFPKEYKIGGKTGTAQVAVQGQYDASKTIASFIGFAPVEDPKFIAYVVVREPKSSQWGSETAAPVFFEIAKDLFVYYNIVPGSETGR